MGCTGKVETLKQVVPLPPEGAVVSASGWYLDSHSISGSAVTLNALKPPSDEVPV